MSIKPGVKEFLWMSAGAAILLAVMLVALHFKSAQSPAEQSALKAKRAEIASQMSLNLALASEAEKSAVMSVTEQDSQAYAEQARAAVAKVEQESSELDKLLAGSSTTGEKEILSQFLKIFADYKRIDDELLGIAVKNTNIKAYGLAFGPAAEAAKEIDTALSKLLSKSAGSPEDKNITSLAFGAQAGVLRIQTMLAPHIAEESDKKMDEIEAKMSNEDNQVRKNFDSLAALKNLHGDPDLVKATAAYARFSDIRKNIIVLSRENTNVRSLAISLGQKRKVSLLCQDTLSALK
jgi:hypothetical protein